MDMHRGSLKIAALIFFFAMGGIHAEERLLNEVDIQKLLPFLQAEAAQIDAVQAYLQRKEAVRSSFSGDPLEFFRRRAKVDLPERANYQPRCSVRASAGGPVAIFTFGRNIDCYERTLLDFWRNIKRSPEEKLPPKPTMSRNCQSEHEQTMKFLKDVREALDKKGFVVLVWGEVDREFASADGIFKIALYPFNIYDRANLLDNHPLMVIESEQAREAALAACSDMPSGPILVLYPGDRFFEKEPLNTLNVALQKAGLTEKEYKAMKEALFLARMDTQPDWFQAAEAAAGNDPAALRDLATRRANANLYRKRAAQLDPLLDALIPN